MKAIKNIAYTLLFFLLGSIFGASCSSELSKGAKPKEARAMFIDTLDIVDNGQVPVVPGFLWEDDYELAKSSWIPKSYTNTRFMVIESTTKDTVLVSNEIHRLFATTVDSANTVIMFVPYGQSLDNLSPLQSFNDNMAFMIKNNVFAGSVYGTLILHDIREEPLLSAWIQHNKPYWYGYSAN